MFKSFMRHPVWFALVAVLCAAAWQALTVHYNYGGNWTALFCTGSEGPAPPSQLSTEHIYRFANSLGYDGRYYHCMAHDPFLKRGFQSSIDSPRLRYRRILVPFSAWLLAGGRDRVVDRAYVVVTWLWVFAGTLWSGLVARQRGMHPAWSLAFLFVPAVIVSLDRLTVDVALVALTAGLVNYAERRNWQAAAALCTLACLVRETGLLIPAALAAWCAMERRWLRAAGLALSVVPALAWYWYVDLHTAPEGANSFLSAIPFAGIASRLVYPISYHFSFVMNALATVLDYAALAGIIAALVYCGAHWRRLLKQPDGLIAFAFVALVSVVSSQDVWGHPYAFARAYSPLLLIVALDGFRSRSPVAALPVALTAPRIGLEIGFQIVGVARGLLGL